MYISLYVSLSAYTIFIPLRNNLQMSKNPTEDLFMKYFSSPNIYFQSTYLYT